MNIFWVGLKNKKGIFLAILALFTVAISSLGSGNQAFADDYKYNNADCSKGGFEYDPQAFGTRAGVGCVVKSPIIKDGKVTGTEEQTIGSPSDLVKLKPTYVLKEGGTCFNGYTKKDISGVEVCEISSKNKKAKDAGYPPGAKPKDGITEKSCKEAGGYYFLPKGVSGWGEKRCHLNNLKGELEPFNNFNSFPSKYLTKDKCASGYNKSNKQQLKEFTDGVAGGGASASVDLKKEMGVYTCAKKGTKAGDNVEKCNKKENEDSEECKNNPAGEDDGDSDGSNDKNSCAIEWVGWIMCPIIRMSNGMVVSTYSVMQKHFLNIKADEIFQQDKPAFKTWSSFRDIANVFFVIILSIIIFSQVSGVGISNYGIKKMLPKIIVFAILVNISWYVSVLMIDISNIVGHSLFEWLSNDGQWDYSSDSQTENNPIEQILGGAAVLGVGTAAGVTGALAAGSSALLFLFSAALALIMMVFILLIRQAAVIVLVVISPVAFVAGILPNTEGFFKKWMKFLKNMLMIYPICSLIVGGAIFVSNLLYSNESSPLLKVAYGLLPILSLFTIVAIIKSVLSIIDGLTGGNLRGTLDRMSGRINNSIKESSPIQHIKDAENRRTVGDLPIGRNKKLGDVISDNHRFGRYVKGVGLTRARRQYNYEQKRAAQEYDRDGAAIDKILAKDNLTPEDYRELAARSNSRAAFEKSQTEGMTAVIARAIGGNVNNLGGQLDRIDNVSDPTQKALLYGSAAQAATKAGLSAADQETAMNDIVNRALSIKDDTQRQAAMTQIASRAGSDMKSANPAAAKAAMQDVSNSNNIKSVSDFAKEASTYAGASAQQMSSWSTMSSNNTADNKVVGAIKEAFKNGDQAQIAHAQNIGKIADQALKAHNEGKMFLTPAQERNFKDVSNTVKVNTPAPVSSQNVQTSVNYNTQNQYTYGAPAPTPKSVVGQYKSNKP